MEYEFTTFFDIASDSIATATKDRTDLFSTVNAANMLDKKSFLITPSVGEELLGWLNTGSNAELTKEQVLIGDIENLLVGVILDPTNVQDDYLIKNRFNLNVMEADKLEKIKQYLTDKLTANAVTINNNNKGE